MLLDRDEDRVERGTGRYRTPCPRNSVPAMSSFEALDLESINPSGLTPGRQGLRHPWHLGSSSRNPRRVVLNSAQRQCKVRTVSDDRQVMYRITWRCVPEVWNINVRWAENCLTCVHCYLEDLIYPSICYICLIIYCNMICII